MVTSFLSPTNYCTERHTFAGEKWEYMSVDQGPGEENKWEAIPRAEEVITSFCHNSRKIVELPNKIQSNK